MVNRSYVKNRCGHKSARQSYSRIHSKLPELFLTSIVTIIIRNVTVNMISVKGWQKHVASVIFLTWKRNSFKSFDANWFEGGWKTNVSVINLRQCKPIKGLFLTEEDGVSGT